MRRADLLFERPEELVATAPAESAGRARDAGRLLVSSAEGHQHGRFDNLAQFLQPGDLLVVNRSATLPASLPAQGPVMLNRGRFPACRPAMRSGSPASRPASSAPIPA
jgi:S-adenosylmethionine:tRNA ribosyltransferase-isomerase